MQTGRISDALRGFLQWLNNPLVVLDRKFCQNIVDQVLLHTVLILCLSFVIILGFRARLSLRTFVYLLSRPIGILCFVYAVWLVWS